MLARQIRIGRLCVRMDAFERDSIQMTNTMVEARHYFLTGVFMHKISIREKSTDVSSL